MRTGITPGNPPENSRYCPVERSGLSRSVDSNAWAFESNRWPLDAVLIGIVLLASGRPLCGIPRGRNLRECKENFALRFPEMCTGKIGSGGVGISTDKHSVHKRRVSLGGPWGIRRCPYSSLGGSGLGPGSLLLFSQDRAARTA